MDLMTAIQMDRQGGTFYEDLYGVFGSESGFCYKLCVDLTSADALAAQMNLDYGGVP